MGPWRALQFIVLFGAACSDASGDVPPHPCEAALADESDRARALEVCVGPEWQPHARLAEAWIAYDAGEHDKALAIATTLLETVVGVEAALIAGFVEARKPDLEAEARGRQYLRRAFDSFQRSGNHKLAVRAAVGLSRVPRPERYFEDKLDAAQFALGEAELAEDRTLTGRALLALADAYDALGDVEEARNHYIKAEEVLKDLPEEVAWVWSKHAMFVLDAGNSGEELEIALRHLELAARYAKRARTAGKGSWEAFDFGLALNRAVVLARQDHYDEADRTLDAAGDPQNTKLMMVRGIIAARRGDLDGAMRLFAAARTGNVERDYEWNMELELARLHRKAGRVEEAAARYRAAIDVIEEMRRQPSELKLRPWVLDRRRQPYVELIAMLARAGQFTNALEVAEWLHGRAWQDAVFGRTGTGRDAVDDALRDMRLASAASSAPRLTTSQLADFVGGREALVFVTVDDGLWRFHLAGGTVRAEWFGTYALDVIEAYRTSLADADRAAKILLPDALTASDEPLIVIGDVAWQTPFAALPRKDGSPLVATRATVYLPGLAALQCSDGSWESRRVALGDAEGDLPAAAGEIVRLAQRFSTQAHTGASATWDKLLSAAGAELLHVAVHVRESDGAMALALSGTDVTASEILEARIAPKVAVLAGCNTADDVRTPESWTGFPSAFLAAGSRFVISTTRAVEDQPAADLVAAYYDQPDSLDPPRRLAAAQREVLTSLPVEQWASFVAWGSPACDFR